MNENVERAKNVEIERVRFVLFCFDFCCYLSRWNHFNHQIPKINTEKENILVCMTQTPFTIMKIIPSGLDDDYIIFF